MWKGESMVPGFDRILVAYGDRQTQVVDDLVAELGASPEERARLRVVAQLVQSVVHTFGTLEHDLVSLETRDFVERRSPSPLPDLKELQTTGVAALNLSMRSLVDAGSLTAWQARVTNLNLGLKRSMFVCGQPDAGQSMILNALIALLPRNQRLAVIAGEEDTLSSIGERSGVVHITLGGGSLRAEAFNEAARAKPDWIVVQEISLEDGPLFLDVLQGSCAGLATMTATDLEGQFDIWLRGNRKTANKLAVLKPLVLRVRREVVGKLPDVELMELTVRDGRTVIIPHTGMN